MRGAMLGLTEAQTLERYRYLVRTAPAELLDAAHRRAFSALGPLERATLVSRLNALLPPIEQVPEKSSDDPAVFSRAATRAEIQEPGVLELALPLADAPLAGSLLGTVVESLLKAEASGKLLGVFEESDPVEEAALCAADPCCDEAFGDL